LGEAEDVCLNEMSDKGNLISLDSAKLLSGRSTHSDGTVVMIVVVFLRQFGALGAGQGAD
jgi:hypothetical protein